MTKARTTKTAPKLKTKTVDDLSLAEIGRQASRDAQQKALLMTLRGCDWNLTVAGERLKLGSPANVLRAIHRLELLAEYEDARSSGKISPANRRSD